MKNLTLCNIAKACGGTLHNYSQDKDREVSGVVLDSRQVEEGFLFIAARGERADGHSFIPEVLAKGAAGVVCERLPERAEGACILVKDSFQALKDIAEYYRQQLSVKVIGITGSVGKTSTKEAVASVLSVRYKVLKTEGNFNNEVGLPLTILRIREGHQAAVIEMGISDFGEMRRLSRIARPHICVLTNIGQCHLENLKSREGILKAKTEIFDFMQEDGIVCLNGDDDMLATVGQVKGKAPISFGLGAANRIRAGEVENKGLFGSRARICLGEKELVADIPLPGEHMVYNALAAACVGSLLDLSEEEIARGIAAMQPVGGRSHVIRLPERVIIDDCYNANPVSMCAALDLLSAAKSRRVAILGDMFELGEREKELHEAVGGYAAEGRADVLICIGALSEAMYAGACGKAGERGLKLANIHYFSGREEFLAQKEGLLQAGDTILVKASHGMAFEYIVKELQR